MKSKSKEKSDPIKKTQPQPQSQQKESKSKPKSKKEKEQEEENIPQPQPKNIERYIYISSYSDIELMSKLKNLFEEINQKAFNFPSTREINTYELSPEEQQNNNLDYISGFQITDRNIRLI